MLRNSSRATNRSSLLRRCIIGGRDGITTTTATATTTATTSTIRNRQVHIVVAQQQQVGAATLPLFCRSRSEPHQLIHNSYPRLLSSGGSRTYDPWASDSTTKNTSQRHSSGGSFGEGTKLGSGGGFGSEYKRDTSDEEPLDPEDIEAIEALIEARSAARTGRDYGEADSIREQLKRDHNVTLSDASRIWSTNPNFNSGNGGERNERFGGGGQQRQPRDFGPNGHDYNESRDASPNASDLSLDEIHGYIAERMHSKMTRDFDNADRIKNLLEDEGIYIDDRNREWRADGQKFSFGGGGGGGRGGGGYGGGGGRGGYSGGGGRGGGYGGGGGGRGNYGSGGGGRGRGRNSYQDSEYGDSYGGSRDGGGSRGGRGGGGRGRGGGGGGRGGRGGGGRY